MSRIEPLPLRTLHQMWRDATSQRMAAQTLSRMSRVVGTLRRMPGLASSADLSAAIIPTFLAIGGWSHPLTRRAVLSSLKSLCRFATIGGYADKSAFDDWSAFRLDADPSLPPPRPCELTAADIERLWVHLEARAEQWNEARLYVAVAFALHTDMTRGEFLPLRWEHVDLLNRRIHVAGRALHSSRYARSPRVPISLALAGILNDWRARCDFDWVIPNRRGRSPWTGGSVGRKPLDVLKIAGRAAGIVPSVTFDELHRFHVEHAIPVLAGLPEVGSAAQGATGSVPATAAPIASGEPAGSSQCAPASPGWLELGPDRHTPPIVLGVCKRCLRQPGFRVIKALQRAGENGLLLPQLASSSGCGDARGILKRLAEGDPEWKQIIHFPGPASRRGYYLAPPAGWKMSSENIAAEESARINANAIHTCDAKSTPRTFGPSIDSLVPSGVGPEMGRPAAACGGSAGHPL